MSWGYVEIRIVVNGEENIVRVKRESEKLIEAVKLIKEIVEGKRKRTYSLEEISLLQHGIQSLKRRSSISPSLRIKLLELEREISKYIVKEREKLVEETCMLLA